MSRKISPIESISGGTHGGLVLASGTVGQRSVMRIRTFFTGLEAEGTYFWTKMTLSAEANACDLYLDLRSEADPDAYPNYIAPAGAADQDVMTWAPPSSGAFYRPDQVHTRIDYGYTTDAPDVDAWPAISLAAYQHVDLPWIYISGGMMLTVWCNQTQVAFGCLAVFQEHGSPGEPWS